jgi:hypothetical protein
MYDYLTENTEVVINSYHKQTMVNKIQHKETWLQKTEPSLTNKGEIGCSGKIKQFL